VFWDATNKVVNKTTTSQQCVGIAVEAAANPSATVAIKLGCYTAVAA
jgi:predicted RecA/RadA family phage recombinase